MKISANVDCTPEEARRFMGLPDLSSVHDAYVSKLQAMVEEGVTPETVERVFRAWSPFGDAGLVAWQRLFDQAPQAK